MAGTSGELQQLIHLRVNNDLYEKIDLDITWAKISVVALKYVTALSPGQPPAINLDLTGAEATVHVGLVGYLRGDVDGSFAGASGALDLDDAQPGYFTALVAEQPALNLTQFGIYGST